MASGTKSSEKKEAKRSFANRHFGIGRTKEQKGQDNAKKEFDKAFKALEKDQLETLREKDPKGDILINEANSVRSKAESTGDYVQANNSLAAVTLKITNRLSSLETLEKKFQEKAVAAATAYQKLPSQLLAPEGANEEKKQQVADFNAALGDMNKLRLNAEVAGFKNLDYEKAIEMLDTAIDGFKDLFAQFKPLVEAAEKRTQALSKLPEYNACVQLNSSIKFQQAKLALAYGIDERLIPKLTGTGSQAEKEFVKLDIEFAKARSVETGFDEVLKDYDAKFKPLHSQLQAIDTKFTEALKNAPTKAPPKGKKHELPDVLKNDVAEAQKKIEEDDRQEELSRKLEAALTLWQKAYTTVPAELARLLALGKEPGIETDHAKWKGEYEKLRNLVALKFAEKSKLTEAEVTKETQTLNNLLTLIKQKRDTAVQQRDTLRDEASRLFAQVGKDIATAKKGKADGVEKAFFANLETQRLALQPLLDRCFNDQALAYIKTELTRLKTAALSLTKTGPGAAKHAEFLQKLKELSAKVNDATVKKCCKMTHQSMSLDLKALEQAFKKNGPLDGDVQRDYDKLFDLATKTHRDAGEIAQKRDIVDTDKALTEALIEEAIPKAQEAAQKELEGMAGGSMKALAMMGGKADLDTKYLTVRLEAIVARHPSEVLSDYDEMIKSLRAFRVELAKGLESGDFKAVLADIRKRAQDEQMAAVRKEQFETELKEFKSGLYGEARSTLESLPGRVLGKIRLKKREARVKTLETVLSQTEKVAKTGDYDAAYTQLASAQKLAQQIVDFPDGSKPPAKGDFKKLGQKWTNAVNAFNKGVEKLCNTIDGAAKEIVTNDTERAAFDESANKVTTAFRSMAAQFDPKEFDRAILILEGDDEAKHATAKEMALQSMRKYQRILDGDPLFQKLMDNPFVGVNVKELYFALDNINLNVQIA